MKPCNGVIERSPATAYPVLAINRTRRATVIFIEDLMNQASHALNMMHANYTSVVRGIKHFEGASHPSRRSMWGGALEKCTAPRCLRRSIPIASD